MLAEANNHESNDFHIDTTFNTCHKIVDKICLDKKPATENCSQTFIKLCALEFIKLVFLRQQSGIASCLEVAEHDTTLDA